MEKEKITNTINFEPLVSIIIPVYNGEKYICEAIDSAIAQTYSNIEIIVVDDGSTDKTKIVLERYRNKIEYLYKEHEGISKALNFAIEKAKGDYISWLSHDDLYLPQKISKQVNILKSLPTNVRDNTILYSSFELMNEDNNIYDKFEPQRKYPIKKLNNPYFAVIGGLASGCALLIPKKCFGIVGMFNPALGYVQDAEMWFRMFPKFKLLFHPDITFISRRHKMQRTNNNEQMQIKENNELYINMVNKLSIEQMSEISGSEVSFLKEVLEIVYELNYIYAARYIEERIKKIEVLDKKSIINPLKTIALKVYSRHPIYKMLKEIQKGQARLNKKVDFVLDKSTIR